MEPKSVQVALNLLVEGDPMLSPIFSKYLTKEKWTKAESQEVINRLSDLLWNENYTCKMAQLFSPLLLELLTRASRFPEEESIDSYNRHEWLCICLSKLIWNSPEIGRFTRTYFEKTRNLFWRYEGEEQPPMAKKSKTEAVAPHTYQLLKAGHLFLIYDTPYFKDLWSWSVIVKFLKDKDVKARWYAYKCLICVGNVKDSDSKSVLEEQFTEEEKQICWKEEMDMSSLWSLKPYLPLPEDVYKKESSDVEGSVHTETVNVCGVLLNKSSSHGSMDLPASKVVCVKSVSESLSALALAVASSEPVLLQGPVGCGKTSLVEHLALMTGLVPSENFIKVQLGDHVDSKMLLGAHVCTEIPGEFIWKHGVLTRAMIQGHWLLLEDIDCAPMDVISLLVPVLQTRTLVLPGCSVPIKAAPGFQLFATQRLLTGLEGSYLEFRNNGEIIDSIWRKVLLNSLSRLELTEVISSKWPSLIPIIPRLLSVYALFSADLMDDQTGIDLGDSHVPFNTFCRHGRLVSMRDLFKFCDRISRDFDSTSSNCAINVYKDALECFCDSIPSQETRLLAATAITTHFNLPKEKAEHFCNSYKPKVEKTDPVEIGRAFLPKVPPASIQFSRPTRSLFVQTRRAAALLEKVAVSVAHQEPVLLVGETGTGKTSIVQHLAELTNHKLTVINMSQQSDSVDLVGGYKPVDLILVVRPIKEEFEFLFRKAVNVEKNAKFLQHISNCFAKRKFDKLFDLILHAENNIVRLFSKKYRTSTEHVEMVNRWRELRLKIQALDKQMSSSTLAFKFMEGALVKAMKNGEWILLDEINLAEAETLECLAGVLEKDDNALILLEKGENERVSRHPDFHIFACMNPATDVGKKDLPIGIRSRFTEFFVDEMNEKREKADFMLLVHEYLNTLTLNSAVISNVIDFYGHVRAAASKTLSDGTGQNPHYSLRTLCRALKYASSNPCHNVPRSLYEAFCLSFLSQLDNASHQFVTQAIGSRLLDKKQLSVLNQSIPEPGSGHYTEVAGYWIMSGDLEQEIQENYIFTETVQRNLQDLARVVSAARYPVLLQGETSCGKTSLIQYLARATGNVCARINNHEHTDIQDYVGSYTADENGKLVFKEGILVDAMRKGNWIILDELNLAPTEVMEALNRVLDDNRELFITETQTLVKAHPRFMIFATQNPPGHYGGRKILSRAFRNRFIELHFNDIPPQELVVILEKRCSLPASYSKKLVAVMQELQVRRRESGVFAGKHGFITLRDLFRWGERYEFAPEPPKFYDWFQHLADEGFLLLSGRVRLEEEVVIIQEAIYKHLKRRADPDQLFNLSENTSPVTRDILIRALQTPLPKEFQSIVWTYNMRRLAVLVGKAMQYNEPVLLVGSTGCGKTTICQIYSSIFETTLHSVNCHMHSESADFLGGLRPVRDAKERKEKLFDWVDGPLVNAMNDGSFFLADEISLADDSVLERLNSVLEEDQKLFLSEKSLDGCSSYEIVAKDGFQFYATMNPGGDYGKKELSPALRNRFTEIWCPSNVMNESDVIEIVEHNIHRKIKGKFRYGVRIAEFLKFYSETEFGKVTSITMRDIMTWVNFVNAVADKILSPSEAYLHGAFLVFLDSIGSGNTATSNESGLQRLKEKFFKFLGNQTGGQTDIESVMLLIPEMVERFIEVPIGVSEGDSKRFEIGPFHIKCGPYIFDPQSYILKAKTTKANALRLLRAMQLSKPILLEGSPGVGKTSLIDALAKVSGHMLVRINLSEQTDISDLFGADLPVEGGEAGEFAWRDGPLIQALKKGHWILLDELNLASQSVLEGLNACLDHRSEVYISELGMTFPINRNTSRIFGCQNPYRQGGSRKGLPRSFLNRFTQVYVRPMDANDLLYITRHVYPHIPQELLVTMITFNAEVDKLVNEQRACGSRGAPFEFNLRDIFRWCDAINSNQGSSKLNIGEHIKLIYADRMRTPEDKSKIYALYEDLINKQNHLTKEHFVLNRHLDLHVYEKTVQLGYSCVETGGRNSSDSSIACISPGQLSTLESIMKCVEMKWMPILIGPSGSGKSSLIRLLAEISGHQLHVMSVNSEMDTIELLGGFEQVDMNQRAKSIAQDLEPIVDEAILQCIHHPVVVSNEPQHLEKILRQKHLLATMRGSDSCSYASLHCLSELLGSLEDLKIAEAESVISTSKSAVVELLKKAKKKKLKKCGDQFEWVDSILIHALRKGHWLLLDDANFCSPSVLDRLNSLLEPNGVLTVSEQGVVGEDLRVIVPHPDFRIFLTMNPKNGEISRAMRNRGVEIYIDPVNADFVGWRRCLDTSSFAQCKGLVHSSLIYILTTIHRSLVENRDCESPSLLDFLSTATLCGQLLRKNEDPKAALLKSCQMVYVKNSFNPNSRKVMDNCISFHINGSRKITQDSNLPLTSFLPSSLDYRHNALFAAVKKQTAFFAYFLSTLKRDKSIELLPVSYPVPDLPPDISNREKLFCILRVMFESTSMELHKILNYWVQFSIEGVLKSKSHQHLKEDLQPCLQLKNMLIEQFQDPIVVDLLNIIDELCSGLGFQAVKKNEFSIDPRWRPDAYRRLLYHLERCSDSEGENSSKIEMIENQITSFANKFNLLLQLRTWEFMSCSNTKKNLSLYSLVQTEKVSTLLERDKRKNCGVVRFIPAFLENVPQILLGMLKKKTFGCTDDCYWQLRGILCSYYTCRQVCEESVKDSEVPNQLSAFITHFYSLLRKIRILFPSPEDMPSSLLNAFSVIDRYLMLKSPDRTLRAKFLKQFGDPIGFRSEDAIRLYTNVEEVYNSINIFTYLTSPNPDMNNLKLILGNLNSWMSKLTEQTLRSIFGAFMENIKLSDGIIEVRKILNQLPFSKEAKADDGDEIMEICQVPSMSDNKLLADIQLLPLWDYLFIVYNAELLTKNPLRFNVNALLKIGSSYLSVHPKHLAYMLRQEQCGMNGQQAAYLFALSSFFMHIRQGFSSAGLHLLQLQKDENGTSLPPPPCENTNESVWAKQTPLLSYICSHVCDKSETSPLMCHSPLRNYAQKISQLGTTKYILWKNYEKFHNSTFSFRCQSALMVMTWFYRLISLILEMYDVKLNEELFTKDYVSKIFKSAQLSKMTVTAKGVDVLGACFDSFVNLKNAFKTDAQENPVVMWLTAKTYILVGLLTNMLLFPMDNIDPVFKMSVKLKALSKQLQDLLTEMGVRNWAYRTASGQQFDEISSIASPPYVKGLHESYLTMETKIFSVSKRLVFRDCPNEINEAKFDSLKDTMDTYFSNAGSPDSILTVLTQLDQLYHKDNGNASKDCVRKAKQLVNNQKMLIKGFNRKFPFYEDIYLTFVIGLEQISYGLELACQCVAHKDSSREFQHKQFKTISEFLLQFVTTFRSPFHTACLLLNGENVEAFRKLLALGNTPTATTSTFVFKLIKSAILEILNEIKLKKFMDNSIQKSAAQMLWSAFSYLWNIWNVQEIKLKEKKELEESMHVHKVRHHQGELTDEEKIEQQLATSFPNFKKEFADCLPAPPDGSTEEDEKPKELTDLEVDDAHLSPEDMFEVWQLHAAAMSALSAAETKHIDSEWNRHDKKAVDVVTPYLLRHEVVCHIVKIIPDQLDVNLDSVLIDGLILMCNELQKIPSAEDQCYDIYKDPNPAEVVSMHDVLSKLDNHLKELLMEFPDHAQLLLISKLVNRVLSFQITDPIMKFVIGMELILESIQLWEQVAHSKISLKAESEEMTKKIIQYRALELDGWRKGLETVIRKQYSNSSKWWFHMFNTISQFKESKSSESYDALIKTLTQCLEDSPLGEFPARLNILQSYFLQSKLSESSSSNKKLCRVLYNLCCYYEQFLPDIKNRILQIRKPIDKEIKDYVKIARWNDVNFYSVKLSVDKSHRFVVKQVKAFEEALQVPVKQLFTIPSKKNLSNGDVPASWSLEIKAQDFLRGDSDKESVLSVGNREEPFFQKIPHYHTKAVKLSKKLAKSFHVVGYINDLNDFSGSIIESLESLTADTGKKKGNASQEKKLALQNLQKKKQMLAELFKTLRNIGLSYRQGVIYNKNRNENDLFSVPAFEIQDLDLLKYDTAFEEMLIKSTQDTSHYFYKSIAQYELLQKQMENPSSDLTLDVIHRLIGYSGHLISAVQSQRQSIVRISKMVDRIGCFLGTWSDIQNSVANDKYTLIPPQEEVCHREEMLSSLLVQFMTVLGHFGALLNSAPPTARERNDEIPCLYIGSPMLSNIHKNDSGWSRITSAISECGVEIEKHFRMLMDSTPTTPGLASWTKFFQIVDGFKILTAAVDNVLSVIDLAGYAQTQPFTMNMWNLCERIHEEFKSATHARKVVQQQAKITEADRSASSTQDPVIRIVTKLTREVLLSYQDVVANCVLKKDDKSEEESIPDKLFSEKISNYLSDFEICLRLEKVSKLVIKLKKAIQCSNNSVEDLKYIHDSLRLLTNLMPLLNQYFQIVKVYFASSLGMHRTSCKFLTILLQLFNTLATKGFCIPAEIKDEVEKSGGTKFEDIEDGGLGEGEGTKDVSENIETEDQLDDAIKEGQDKKENEDDSDLKDEKHGIEMSDDFEGKSFDPEENEDQSDDSDKEDGEEDLEKKMGDVDTEDAEKLDEKVWGSDSEDEDETTNDDPQESGGVEQNKPSELGAKDGQDRESGKEKESKTAPEAANESQEDEYKGEVPDPMIDAPPDQEPEVVELPDEMEITDDADKGGSDNEMDDSVEIQEEPEEASESKEEPEENEGEKVDEPEETADDGKKKAEEEAANDEDVKNPNAAEPLDEEAEGAENKDDASLPTHTPTTEVQALPSGDAAQSSSQDPVQDKTPMEWESGAQQREDEQHKEGQAESENALEQGAAHEGQKSSMRQQSEQEHQYQPRLKSQGQKRTLDEDTDNENVKRRPISDKESAQNTIGHEDADEGADMYEHVPEKEDGTSKAVDIASEEQAAVRPVESQGNGPMEDDDVIELSSDDEEEFYPPQDTSKGRGDAPLRDQRRRPGERGDDTEEIMDVEEGELVRTHNVARGESLIYTQHELWATLSDASLQAKRLQMEQDLDLFVHAPKENQPSSFDMWRSYEMLVGNLAQELCEQLRLVLEPTKMAKLKGDYRTGKRLNMRKIIPYIASQFRKDKIWLRRTKPSKREYQIMLAVDDSSSMSHNHSKQLAFEAFATIGHSLSLLEAGELAVVRFGENVDLLMGFNERYSTSTGAKVFEQLSFAQDKTSYVRLLNFATGAMAQARTSSAMKSKETAQLLVVISDGRGVFSEGEESVKRAVRLARNNNIFTVFVIIDNPANNDSILDLTTASFVDNKPIIKPYLEKFPFPFYIILRDITALPLILGEALRQWFELVTSTDR